MGVGEGFDEDEAATGFTTTTPLLDDVEGTMAAAGAGEAAAVGGEGAADGQLMVKGLAAGGGGSPMPTLFPVEEAGGVDVDGSSVGVDALVAAAAGAPKVGVDALSVEAEAALPKEATTPPEVGGVFAAPRR